ncbi:ABC transporter permease subunit [Brevibacterium litoralis]|uniref:ABC transporter permease subunit n=1 Tax=Brevibacterium litoralis TaxID=3138935 RepID=UPI0032EA922F
MSTTTTRSARVHTEPVRATRALALTTYELRCSWRSLVVWSIVLVAVGSMYLSLYSGMADTFAADSEMMAAMPEELMNAFGGAAAMSTAAGYAQATYLGLLGFALASVAAIGWAGKAIAGQEEAGDLELVLSHGVSRLDHYAQQSLALLIRVGALGAVSWAMIAGISEATDLDMDPAHIPAGVASLMALVLLAGVTALAAGAATGRKLWASGTAAGVLVVSYMLNAIGSQSEDTEDLLPFSPYHWAYGNEPLANGWSPEVLGVVGLTVGIWLVGLADFTRRDLGH